jgi:hypothetical protein
VNMPLSDYQQPLFVCLGKRLMGELHFECNMVSDYQEEYFFNHPLGGDEISNIGGLCQDIFMMSVGVDGLLESGLFD